MRSAVVFDSKTGNTKLLAHWIAEEIKDCVYCGDIDNAVEADTYFVGFWTDKGSCTDKVKNFLESYILHRNISSRKILFHSER